MSDFFTEFEDRPVSWQERWSSLRRWVKRHFSLWCLTCEGTGEERSEVCYCGENMEGHSFFDNHMATEMTRACEDCQ